MCSQLRLREQWEYKTRCGTESHGVALCRAVPAKQQGREDRVPGLGVCPTSANPQHKQQLNSRGEIGGGWEKRTHLQLRSADRTSLSPFAVRLGERDPSARPHSDIRLRCREPEYLSRWQTASEHRSAKGTAQILVPALERRTRTAVTSGTNADNRPEGYISGRPVAVFNFSSSSTPQTIQSLFLLNLFTTVTLYTKINDYSSLS
jgi:hypothetical protein